MQQFSTVYYSILRYMLRTLTAIFMYNINRETAYLIGTLIIIRLFGMKSYSVALTNTSLHILTAMTNSIHTKH